MAVLNRGCLKSGSDCSTLALSKASISESLGRTPCSERGMQSGTGPTRTLPNYVINIIYNVSV